MAAELNDQEFGSSSEIRLVVHFPGNVQPQFDKEIVVFMFMVVILALVFWMLRIAGKFVRELVREEFSEEVVMEEVPAPPLFVAPVSGRKFHAYQHCRGLTRAGSTRQVDPCAACCPEGLSPRERRKTTRRRMFVNKPGKFLWIKLWAAVALLSMSAALLWKGYMIERARFVCVIPGTSSTSPHRW